MRGKVRNKMEKTRLQDLVIGIIVTIIGIWGWLNTYKMPATTQLYTFCVTGIFTILGVMLVIQSLYRRNVPTEDKPVHPSEFSNPLIAFAVIVIYALMLNRIGFFVSSAIFMVVMALFMGYRKPLKMGITVIGMLGFIYALFVLQLHVSLPSGILF